MALPKRLPTEVPSNSTTVLYHRFGIRSHRHAKAEVVGERSCFMWRSRGNAAAVRPAVRPPSLPRGPQNAVVAACTSAAIQRRHRAHHRVRQRLGTAAAFATTSLDVESRRNRTQKIRPQRSCLLPKTIVRARSPGRPPRFGLPAVTAAHLGPLPPVRSQCRRSEVFL